MALKIISRRRLGWADWTVLTIFMVLNIPFFLLALVIDFFSIPFRRCWGKK